jgi:NADH-quinone oxidoreductase subunit N
MDFILLHQNHFKMFLPEVFLATSILILTLYATYVVSSHFLGYPIITSGFNKICIFVLFLTLLLVYNNTIPFMLTYQNTFIFDDLTAYSKCLILFFSILCLAIFEDSLLKQKINNFEYFILLLCAVLGLMLLVSSFDLISLYLAIELQSLCLYVLAAAKKDSSFSTEAGLKYFILGSFSSGLLLFGISIIYGTLGTTNFENLSLLLAGSNEVLVNLESSIIIGLIFISAAFFFKIAAAPLHMWSPDVYEGAPVSSTIFFAVIPKIAMFSVFLRLFQDVFSNFHDFFLLATVLFSLFSVIIGSFVALKQKKVKRLLAYSSISHVGYMLLAFSANSIEGTQALFFYLIIYMITSLVLWSLLLSVNTSKNADRSKTLVDLSFLSTTNPLLAFTGLIAFFSLAGVPPLVGFYAKMSIFLATISSSLIFASVFAILTSVISSYYYIRIIKNLYFEKRENTTFFIPVTRSCSLVMGTSSFLLIYLFINPTLVALLAEKMALCLF